jgi:hypothetical protein
MFDLPVRVGMSNGCPIYPDVVVVMEVQELLPGEQGPIVGDDRVGDPKSENNILHKAYCLFGANFDQ